jgi:hypothetical protein
MDASDAAAAVSRLYKIAHVRAGARRLAEIIVDSTDRITEALQGLEDRRGVLEAAARLHVETVVGSDQKQVLEDLAEAVIKWLVSESRERRVFELDDGHPRGYSWCEVAETFERLRRDRRTGLITYTTVGDPDLPRSADILIAAVGRSEMVRGDGEISCKSIPRRCRFSSRPSRSHISRSISP